METHTALAKVEGDKATVWASTQNPFGAQRRDCRGARLAGAECPRHHAFRRRRFRRQDAQSRRRSRPPGWPRPSANRCRSPGAAPRSSSTTPSGRQPSSRSAPASTAPGKMAFWDYDVFYAGERGRRSSTPFPITAPRRAAFRLAGAGGRASLRHRRLARAGQQHQHLRPRIADRHHGGSGGHGPGRVPPEEPERPEDDPRAQGRGRTLRLDAGQSAQQTRLRRGLRHRRRRPTSPPSPKSRSMRRRARSRSSASSAPRTWAW